MELTEQNFVDRLDEIVKCKKEGGELWENLTNFEIESEILDKMKKQMRNMWGGKPATHLSPLIFSLTETEG